MNPPPLSAEQVFGPGNDLLRTLIYHLPDNIFIKDRQSRILISNLAHARTLGAAHPDEVVGKTDGDFLSRELANQHYADEQALMASGQPLNREEKVVDPRTGEARWLQTTKDLTQILFQAALATGVVLAL